MDTEKLSTVIGAISHTIHPIQIPTNCSFWMLRTKSGAYYGEYVRERYIAIGWNVLLQKNILQDDNEKLRKAIEANYIDKQPGSAVNKCTSFVQTMKSGDIVMILGEKQVAFGVVGEYFEETEISECVRKEKEADAQIEAGLHREESIQCPYVKRRKIQLIKEVDEKRLTPTLARSLLNHHSLSNADEYAIPILNTCFDLYAYLDETRVVFRVNTQHKIKGRDFAAFTYFLNEFFCAISSEDDVSITTNLNSPGDYVVAIQHGIEFVQSNLPAFIFIFTILFGGSFEGHGFKLDIPSVRGFAKWMCERSYTAQEKELKLAQKREEIDSIKFDNELKLIQIQREKNQLAFDKMPTDQDFQKLQQASQALEIQNPEPNAISFPLPNREDHKDGSAS